jgi:hypothetical protein
MPNGLLLALKFIQSKLPGPGGWLSKSYAPQPRRQGALPPRPFPPGHGPQARPALPFRGGGPKRRGPDGRGVLGTNGAPCRATSVLTATTQLDAIRAGITAGAGTRLVL